MIHQHLVYWYDYFFHFEFHVYFVICVAYLVFTHRTDTIAKRQDIGLVQTDSLHLLFGVSRLIFEILDSKKIHEMRFLQIEFEPHGEFF